MGKATDFLTEFDNIGKPIGLTYKGKGAFKTAAGGVASITLFAIFIGWFAIEITEVYMAPGKFATGTSNTLTQGADGAYPMFSMDGDEFFTTYKLHTSNDTLKDDLDKYLTGLWVQRSGDKAGGIYKPVKCDYDNYTYSTQFMSQVEGQWCADTKGAPVQLKRNNPLNSNDTEYDYFFVLDFCEHFKAYSGRSDCKSIDETLAVMDQIKVQIKISTQLWNVATYVMNGFTMFNIFESADLVLNKEIYQRQAYRVKRESISLYNSYLVNWSWQDHLKTVAYSVLPQLSSIYPNADKGVNVSSNPKDVFLSIRFSQADTQSKTKSTREAIANTFQRFGSFLALTLRFIGYVFGRWQKFSLDKNILNELYTYKMDDEEKRKRDEKAGRRGDDDRQGGSDDEQNKKYAEKMNKEKDSRRPFAYSGFDLYSLEFFSSPWCFCCRKSAGRRDKLYGKATGMMGAELDVIEILKKLRVNKFTSDCFLTQEQRDLVILHQDYKVGLETDPDFQKREKRAVNDEVMSAAINKLQPESVPIDMISYQAIVGQEEQRDDAAGGYYSPNRRNQPEVRTQDNDLRQNLIEPEDNRQNDIR